MGISIAIPTYYRGRVLCETIELLLALKPPASEILVVDQTPEQPADVADRLARWTSSGAIRLIDLPQPSIPRAMNLALREARERHVLFLDDDVLPSERLLRQHAAALEDAGVWSVVGQVLQPGEVPEHFEEATLRRGALRDLEFRFNHDQPCDVQNVIACNLSVDRDRVLSIGGFDENFVAVAYRFETDFALRIVAAGGRVRFHPEASIRHLKAPGGGVRSYGDHRSSSSPAHSVGDYYFALRHVPHFWRYAAQRLRRNVLTRYHLRHPWAIPPKVVGEIRGLLSARRLAAHGKRTTLTRE
jgi:GT2 family glycosyltransferase